MFINNSFGRSIDILHRTMSVNVLRQQVIADNIANSDTPNFKRSTVNFETGLKKALQSETEQTFPAALTNEKHIPFDRPVDYRTVLPRRTVDWQTTSKNNGNNVDIEEETSNAVQAQLAYNMMVQSVVGEFNNINMLLRG